VIKATKVIKGSQNLNGSGFADQVIDEKELEKAGKKTILQLFEEKIPGFRLGTITMPSHDPSAETSTSYNWYYIKDKLAVFFFDGMILTNVLRLVITMG
jgi:hypothetical protein